jgi:hypothetical protein
MSEMKRNSKVVAACTWSETTLDEGARIAARVLAIQATAFLKFAQELREDTLTKSASSPLVANVLVMAQGYESAADAMMVAARNLLRPKRAKPSK